MLRVSAWRVFESPAAGLVGAWRAAGLPAPRKRVKREGEPRP